MSVDGAALLDAHVDADRIDPRHVDFASVEEVTYVLHNDISYEYPAPIRALRHRLVVVPRYRHGDQRRVAHRLDADVPTRAAVRHRYDRFGNPVVDVEAPVIGRMSFCLRAVLHRTHNDDPDRPWRDGHSAVTRLTELDHDLREAAQAIEPGADGRELVTAIGHAVRSAMTYEHGLTSVRTTASEAWHLRRGVCQDMAHVMIAMCRARGLRARYVSGHLLGEGASHAWVEVHDDTTRRTMAFDPTHDRPTDLRYVTVAVGRDYRDVAPTAGSYRAGPRGTLSVRKAVAIAAVR